MSTGQHKQPQAAGKTCPALKGTGPEADKRAFFPRLISKVVSFVLQNIHNPYYDMEGGKEKEGRR